MANFNFVPAKFHPPVEFVALTVLDQGMALESPGLVEGVPLHFAISLGGRSLSMENSKAHLPVRGTTPALQKCRAEGL